MTKKTNDITVPSVINGVNIPAPSKADLQWAKEIRNKKGPVINEALNDILTGDQNLYRIAFIVNIPKIDNIFKSRGLSPNNTYDAPNQAIKMGSVDIFKILYSEDTAPPHRGAICKALHSSHHEILTYLNQNFDNPLANINYTRSYYYADNTCYTCMGLKSAVYSGNIDMVKLLIENGENLIQSGEDALSLAKARNSSEIYKYLKVEIDKAESAFTAEEPTQPLLTMEKSPWEKIDATSIAKHQILEDGQAKISNIYDFESGQVTTVYQKDGMPPSTPTFQNFDDIQKDTGITSAFNKLVALEGKPKPYIRGQIDKKNTVRVFKVHN